MDIVMRRFTSWCSIVALVLTGSAFANEEKVFSVVTTVKPLNMIVQDLTAGITRSDALLPPGTSPHDYALRPSDMKKLRDADLVIWVGPELEMFIAKMVEGKENSLALTEQHSIDFRHYEHAVENDHDDHNHNHDGIDPHLWLGPKQAIQAANVITKALVQHDPLHKKGYEDNLTMFISEVNQTVSELNNKLKPLADHGYFVFHDGYGYFEEQFGLNNLGHFTVEPDRRPGAKTLISIRRALQDQQAFCVFSEPQFSPAVVSSVVSGTGVKIGTLDPMATEIAEGEGGYARFLTELGASFTKCLE
ncbi:zinc ABC transporter substrate-binding protein ZnuA [Photobacterium sp.]|uniref:zinc ABC transporter substrate-binding protein ZnuA n=1 Tax=Photobacterium sp. TaxID=660 RepID=UPI00299F2089|nr:zinc ABC transporter substrate-binding protein ZnuA [Photobacterium sp.]MDX1303167.1 zinc ABC transporter substrate-binding protein ZnuA [Photobacterium sp.]